ncbi:MAG: TetR/AcrR family transcriptional regulator [Halobacteriovoraceae bacterium]|nr:TetR/AcrR family transcriptional regulator [Halobacteriovoraceae bacterium]
MGRKSRKKEVYDNPQLKNEWALSLMPHFQEKGIKGFGMDKVAAVLEKSKATVYKYFRTREEILEIIIQHKIQKISSFESIISDESLSFEERYFTAVSILSESIGDISTKFLRDLKKYHPELWINIEVFRDYAIGVLSNFYEEGMKESKIREVDLSILKLADELFFSALLNPEFLRESNLSLQKAFDQYFELKWKGMKI